MSRLRMQQELLSAIPLPPATYARLFFDSTRSTTHPSLTWVYADGTVGSLGSLFPENIEGRVFVDPQNTQGWAGADAGAWINAAYAYLQATYTSNNGGVIELAPGTYTFSTPIVLANAGLMSIVLRGAGDGNGATILNYTATNLPCISVGGGSGNDGGVQLENFTITGTAQGNTCTAIQLGVCVSIIQTLTISAGATGNWTATWNGLTATALSPTITAAALQTALQTAWNDTAVTVTGGPGGTAALTVTIPGSNQLITATNPATSGTTTVGANTGSVVSVAGALLKCVSIRRFTTGINWGVGSGVAIAYAAHLVDVKVQQCTVGCAPFGEANAFFGGLIGGNASGIVPAGASCECNLFGTAFDDNTVTAINLSNAFQRFSLMGVRFENAGLGTSNYLTISNGSLNMHGGSFQEDNVAGGPATGFVQATGGIVNMQGVWVYSGGRVVTQLFNVVSPTQFKCEEILISPAAASPATTLAQRVQSQYVGALTAATAALTAADTLILSIPIPANSIQNGQSYRIKAWGQYAATVTNAVTFRVRFGTANSIADGIITSVVSTTAGITTVGFEFEAVVTFRSLGGAGSAIGYAKETGLPAAAFAISNTAAVAVNTTANNFLSLTAGPAATTSNVTFQGCTIEPIQLND